MMQAQVTKLQEDMAGTDVKMMQMQLKELQEELLYLRNKLLPVADTMPNFALESQGKSSSSSSNCNLQIGFLIVIFF